MSHFALLWKARTIEKYRFDYESEKINSIMSSKSPMPKQSLSQRWRHYRYDTRQKISRTFRKWYPEGSSVSNLLVYLRTDQTYPNFVLKSILGFVGGIVLTYLCFMFFVFQLSISLMHATIMSSIIGVLLTLGLAFSYRIRCLVFLLIPQFFSRVGRYTLTCYALVLILTGPATNTLKNSEVLTESLACGQEQIKTSVGHIKTLMDRPLNSIKDSVKVMVEKLRNVAIKVNTVILKLNRLILSLSQVINTGYLRLNSLTTTCNEELNPYGRCMHSLKDGVEACKSMFGSNGSTLCNTQKVEERICSKYKQNLVFVFFEHLNGNIIPIVKRRLEDFTDRIKHMFRLQVHVHHSYSFSSNTSRTACQVAAGIVTEIRRRADPLLTWLSWSSYVTSLFLLLIIFRAKSYQHMFETRSRFDNRYITKDIRILDLKRQRERRETILPLNRREQAKYVTTTSFRLVASEKAYLSRSVIFMTVTTFKLMIHMIADYSLYWVLMTIRHHGSHQTLAQPGAEDTGIHISGSGLTSDLLRAIVAGLSVLLDSPSLSSMSCLPNPSLPDLKRYTQIGVLILLLWFFSMFEPYGLRLRHVVMGHYQPDRAKTRAVWLYNHILRARAGFMKLARRKLHRTYKYRSEELTFAQWLQNHVPFLWLRSVLGINAKDQHCLLCGTVYYKSQPDTQLIRCRSADCPGVYCDSCFADIGELCTICLAPEDYGDHSDVSIEKGSSEDTEGSDDELGFSKISKICKLNIFKTDKQASVEISKRHKRNMFSRTKSDQHVLIPLISKRNNSLDSAKNCTERSAVQILSNIVVKASTQGQRKMSNIVCKYFYNRKELQICCYHYNLDCALIYYKEIFNLFGGIIKNSILTVIEAKSCQFSMFLNQKPYKRSNYEFNNQKRTFKNFKTEKKFCESIFPKYLHKKSISSKNLTKGNLRCSFYRILTSAKSIKIYKISKNSKIQTTIEKYLKASIKCKMKRKKNVRCVLNKRKYPPKEESRKHTNLTDNIMKIAPNYEHRHRFRLNSCYSEKGNDSKAHNRKKYLRKNTQIHSGSSFGMQRLQLPMSDYWRNIIANKRSIVQATCNIKTDEIISQENEKFKWRKKKKNKLGIPFVSNRMRLRNEGVRNEDLEKYRISAFLSDQEWTKGQWKNRAKVRADFKAEFKGAYNCNNMGLSDNRNFDNKQKEKEIQKHSNKNSHVADIKITKKDVRCIVQNQDVTVTKTQLTIKDVCKKYGCDLITVTSSNTSMGKILKAVREVFEKEQHSKAKLKCKPFDKYKEFYKSVANIETLCKGECESYEVEDDDSEECQECNSEDMCNPYIIFSDGSSKKICLHKKKSPNIKSSLKNFGSDISNRLVDGYKSSITFLKNLRGIINKSDCWSKRQTRLNKQKNCDDCCNSEKITKKGNDQADKWIQSKQVPDEMVEIPSKICTGNVCCCSVESLNFSSDSEADECDQSCIKNYIKGNIEAKCDDCCNPEGATSSSSEVPDSDEIVEKSKKHTNFEESPDVEEGNIKSNKSPEETKDTTQKINMKTDTRSKATGNKANASTNTKKPLETEYNKAETQTVIPEKASKVLLEKKDKETITDKSDSGNIKGDKDSKAACDAFCNFIKKMFKSENKSDACTTDAKILKNERNAMEQNDTIATKKPDYCDACCDPRVKKLKNKADHCDACCNTERSLSKKAVKGATGIRKNFNTLRVKEESNQTEEYSHGQEIRGYRSVDTKEMDRSDDGAHKENGHKKSIDKDENGPEHSFDCKKLLDDTYKFSSGNKSDTSFVSTSETRANSTIYTLTSFDRRYRQCGYTSTTSKAVQTIKSPRGVCNVSTNTKDWWSPLVEKREQYKKPYRQRGTKKETDRKEIIKMNRMRRRTDRANETDRRVVTFRSMAQIIPSDDKMTPYRYLLESQRYYNELYRSRNHITYNEPFQQRYIVGHGQQNQPPSAGSHQYRRRNRKTKRLCESYSPRKQPIYEWIKGGED